MVTIKFFVVIKFYIYIVRSMEKKNITPKGYKKQKLYKQSCQQVAKY